MGGGNAVGDFHKVPTRNTDL